MGIDTISVLLVAVVTFALGIHATIDCNEAFECQNSIIENVTTVTASGYKSVWKSIIEDGISIKLLGSFSGYKSRLLHSESQIISQASFAMSKCDSIINIGAGNIFCQASSDCTENTLINSLNNGTIYCNGDSSCMDSKIDSTNNIFGNGAFSLTNTQISTNNIDLSTNNELNVYLFGYFSGYGTNITCLDGYVCNIYCGDYACMNNMIFNSLGNDGNIIIHCVNGNDECLFAIDEENTIDIDYVSSYINYNNDVCDNDGNGNNVISYDDGNENGDSIVNNLYLNEDVTNICFRGHKSGILSNITFSNSVLNCTISCHGGESCAYSQISMIDDKSDVKINLLCSGLYDLHITLFILLFFNFVCCFFIFTFNLFNFFFFLVCPCGVTVCVRVTV